MISAARTMQCAVLAAVLLGQTVTASFAERYVTQGIAIDLDVAAPGGVRVGEDVRLSLRLSDVVADAPLVAASRPRGSH